MIPITLFYRKLDRNGMSDGSDGLVLGSGSIPLTTFLPLIGSAESVAQWLPITDETKEVRGLVHVVCRVDSNISRSERMLPKAEAFAKVRFR